MNSNKSIGRAIGWLIFHGIGWRRFLSLIIALIAGWITAGCIIGITLNLYPRPDFPIGKPEAMDQYNAAMSSRELPLNIVGVTGVILGLIIAVVVFRFVRKRFLCEPEKSIDSAK